MIQSTRKATREQTKQHNNRLVLSTIYQQGEVSRADIARTTHLTATTVSSIVVDYLEKGLVAETGSKLLARGKPATLLSVVDDAYHLIGLDLARSEFQGAVMNLRGEKIHQAGIPIEGQTGEAALNLVYNLIDQLLEKVESPLLGIGIAAPGIIDAENGIVRYAVNFGWYDLPLQDLLTERYDFPVQMANDNHVAVLAEQTFGNHTSNQDLVVLKVGHGVGAGIILNGQLFYGAGHGAGEIGHVRVVEDGELCSCGNHGCLETITSSRALVKRAQTIAENDPNSPLHQFALNLEEMKIADVVHAFNVGDPALQTLVEETGDALGLALANVVGVLSVSTILVAGSVAGFGEPLLERMQTAVNTSSLSHVASHTQIELASLDQNIVLLGTTALLLSQELGVM